jgi:hypothetical protein
MKQVKDCGGRIGLRKRTDRRKCKLVLDGGRYTGLKVIRKKHKHKRK